jgi:hypothetical protein
MTRYFFHIQDGVRYEDKTGTELPDITAVRVRALKVSGDMLASGTHPDLWEGHEWRLTVTDEAGQEVLALRFSAQQRAA